MGAYCSKNSELKDKVGRADSLFGDRNFSIPQILVVGPSGSGKTTLLYKTFFPGWKDITTQMEPTTCGFHYEELHLGGQRFGIWDVAGDLSDMWPMFYRSVRMDAVVYVVSLADINEESVRTSRRWIRILVNEDELRKSLFCIVMNTFDVPSEQMADPNKAAARLGLSVNDLPINDPSRLFRVVANVKQGTSDPEWYNALSWIVRNFPGKKHH